MLTYKRVLVLSVIAALALSWGLYAGYESSISDRGTNYSKTKAIHENNEPRLYQVGQLSGTIAHNNKQLAYSQRLSNTIANLPGVSNAYVLQTERNAYVAITLDQTAIGTRSARKETNNAGTNVGIYDTNNPEYQSINSNDIVSGANGPETVRDHEQLSHALKQRIAQTLRSQDTAIQDVFISAHRKFVNAVNNYAQESWKGQPLTPYVQDFNRIVSELFGTQILPQR